MRGIHKHTNEEVTNGKADVEVREVTDEPMGQSMQMGKARSKMETEMRTLGRVTEKVVSKLSDLEEHSKKSV